MKIGDKVRIKDKLHNIEDRDIRKELKMLRAYRRSNPVYPSNLKYIFTIVGEYQIPGGAKIYRIDCTGRISKSFAFNEEGLELYVPGRTAKTPTVKHIVAYAPPAEVPLVEFPPAVTQDVFDIAKENSITLIPNTPATSMLRNCLEQEAYKFWNWFRTMDITVIKMLSWGDIYKIYIQAVPQSEVLYPPKNTTVDEVLPMEGGDDIVEF